MAYVAERQATGKGRPKVIISESQLDLLRTEGFTAKQMAARFGCSTSIIYKKIYERGIKLRSKYSNITDEELTGIIQAIHHQHPNSGSEMLNGYLKCQGYVIQRSRIRHTLQLIDPVGTETRRKNSIKRRKYNVPSPNSLWHMDAHCKLIRWGFITHGCIDGYSRLVTYAQCTLSATAETVLNLFVPAIFKYGLPSRVRSDHGYENLFVAVMMNVLRGLDRNSHITGSSVHNQRIERLWKDVYEQVIIVFHEKFYELESDGKLDPGNNIHRFVLQHVYLKEINFRLNTFIEGWNNHKIRTARYFSPRQLWLDGLLENFNTPLTGVQGVFIENVNMLERVTNALEELGVTVNENVIDLTE